MSTPMYDMPEHMRIGVTADGHGPVELGDPEFDRFECWCQTPGCTRYLPHLVTSPGGAAYSCSCPIGEDHAPDAWVSCPACLEGIARGDIRDFDAPHSLGEGCYFRQAKGGPS